MEMKYIQNITTEVAKEICLMMGLKVREGKWKMHLH